MIARDKLMIKKEKHRNCISMIIVKTEENQGKIKKKYKPYEATDQSKNLKF